MPDKASFLAAKGVHVPPGTEINKEFVYDAVGKWNFYEPYLLRLTQRDLIHTWPREPLHTSDLDVIDTGSTYMLTCQVFFVPECRWLVEYAKVPVTIQSPQDLALEREARVLHEMLSQQHAHAKQVDKSGGVVCEGDSICCSILARIDGQLWDEGSAVNTTLVVAEDVMQPKALYELMLGRSVGSYQAGFQLDAQYGKLEGKEVTAEIVIHSIFEPSLLTEDEVAKLLNFSDAKSWRAELEVKYKQQQDIQQQRLIEKSALDGLAAQLEIETAPMAWLRIRAQDIFNHLMARTGGDRGEVLHLLGVADENAADLRLISLAKGDVNRVAALMTYGATVGITRDRNETFSGLHLYLDRALRHLVEHYTVVGYSSSV